MSTRGPSVLARVASLPYRAAVRLRNLAYDRGWLERVELGVPVICVGNLTVGGTGKTPVAGEVARMLSQEGWLVGILSRGYGGARLADPMIASDLWHVLRGPSEAGDEPYVLARSLPGVPVVVGRDRVAAGKLALQRFPLHVLVLDDGFQHRRLSRAVDLVLLDSTDPWGGGHLLPAGRLREPTTALARAHAVLLTRTHQAGPDAVGRIFEALKAAHPQLPVLTTRSMPLFLRDLGTRGQVPVANLRGKRVVAVAGTARPEAFFVDLEEVGAILVKRFAYRDHHPFTQAETWSITQAAKAVGAEAVITTEKDSVRFPLPAQPAVRALCLVQRVVPDDPSALLRILASRLPGPSRGGRHAG